MLKNNKQGEIEGEMRDNYIKFMTVAKKVLFMTYVIGTLMASFSGFLFWEGMNYAQAANVKNSSAVSSAPASK